MDEMDDWGAKIELRVYDVKRKKLIKLTASFTPGSGEEIFLEFGRKKIKFRTAQWMAITEALLV